MDLLNSIITAFTNAVNATSNELEELQRKQFASGNDSEGNSRGRYSRKYARKKGKSSPVDLKLTGDSYKQTKAKANSKGIEIEVGTDYFKYLVKKYGKNTIGLEDELWQKYFNNTVIPRVKN